MALNFYHNRRKHLEAKAQKKEALYASIKSYADPVINAFQKWHTLKVNLDRLRLFAESDDFKKQKMAFSHLSEYIQMTDEAWKEYQSIKKETEQMVESSGKRESFVVRDGGQMESLSLLNFAKVFFLMQRNEAYTILDCHQKIAQKADSLSHNHHGYRL